MFRAVEVSRISLELSDVGDVSLGPEYSDELVFVVVDVALHDLHARAEQTLERVHVQNWNRETEIPD